MKKWTPNNDASPFPVLEKVPLGMLVLKPG